MSELILSRTIEQWKNCDPQTMASMQSDAAIRFAFADAKSDILRLHSRCMEIQTENEALRARLAELEKLEQEKAE